MVIWRMKFTREQVLLCGRWCLTLALLLVLTQTMSAQGEEPVKPAASGDDVYLYLPIMFTSPPLLTLNPVPRPNSANQWTVSWSDGGSSVTQYELQESHTADFAAVTTYTGTTTSQAIQHPASLDNSYFYRVRATVPTGTGEWSNVQSVIGGYRDEFNDPNSGWQMRRTTNLDRVWANYTNGNLEIVSEDGFDWGIFSPLRQAPPVPYAIEYFASIDPTVVAASHGAVFGGDWNGQPCPDYSSLPGVYEHDICFNHFYNTNLIWYVGQSPALQLIFERVDYLIWCPGCGGSPMKRLTNDPGSWVTVNPVPNASPSSWNSWRVEVRSNGIKLLVNGVEYASSSDTTWINDPYYGLFVSADAYEPGRWVVDYYQVTYLDN